MTTTPEPVDLAAKRGASALRPNDWKPRTIEALREALQRFCDSAWNRGARVRIFTIPVDDERDADCILSDGISELEHLRALVRAQRAALEAAPIAQAMSALESDATKDQRRAAWDALADWADSSGTVLARTRDEKGGDAMTDPKLPTVTYPGGLSPTEHAIQQAQAWMVAHTLANSPTPGSEYLIIRDLLGVALAKRERDADLQGRYDAGVVQGALAQRETDARMCEAVARRARLSSG